MRTSEKRRLRNVSFKSKLKTHKKKLLGLIETGQKEEAVKFFKTVTSLYDKGVKKGIIKLNNAARNKSRLAAKINRIS